MERDYEYRFKRTFDILAAIFLLLATSWIFILVILVYIVQCQSHFFFIQPRIGKGEQIFAMYKFRTLRHSGESLQERRFIWGDMLRRTSLDELPQLVNILKGDMSFVGPRPLPVEYLPLFSNEQRVRHDIRPGITGLAQISGRHSIPWEKKFALDLCYIRNISFLLDVKILLKTFFIVLSFKKDTSLMEPKFTGSLKK